MFCPSCRDEFRAGFTRCARCQVDLIEDLSELDAARAKTKTAPQQAPAVMVDVCGFFTMKEAAHAREQLRAAQIRTEIVLREPVDVDWDAPPQDEFWLRVDASRIREVQKLMGPPESPEPAQAEESTFACGDCGHDVAEAESFCPNCGAQFDDD